ncbi:DUF1743 domain-containing protein [Infirmifilum lucidum]|uniref:tRNA(Ile2) 2-agmatinylcytidine synthetase TiaS n=1 Tax=Infirmifilum lucidum TaxID=2776706 RepID=A0A7L9FGJ8_9CREN|nr:tRNA(Ile)(2)-agmatinylcytidine synthase [Infirmifilum lucidum]QOJ78056.1 DUF1743 domain-containing protein [Infirmifilum lucidum]
MELHVGVDDVDSPDGYCTSYLGYLLTLELHKRGARLLDLPYLVRLNPNIPFKTRGNAAVSIHVDVSEDEVPEVIELVENLVMEHSEQHGKTSPGFAIAKGRVNSVLRELYNTALTSIVPRGYVEEIVKEGSAETIVTGGRKEKRGVIGALAAIGAYPLEDYTYELLVYRSPTLRGHKTSFSEDVILDIDRRYRPIIFATYDYSEERLLAVPRGPDPVLLGLRSVSVYALIEVLDKYLSPHAKEIGAEGFILYKSNQATNAHLRRRKQIADIRPYDSVVVSGVVWDEPVAVEGGHVKVRVCDGSGCINSMFYKETGRLNRAARLLRMGDEVEIGGGVVPRKGLTLNAEFLRVLSLKTAVNILNPPCPVCGARMESAGRNKGFKCSKCGYRSRHLQKIREELPRVLEPSLYVQSMRAYRHLTRPLEIQGLSSEPSPTFSPIAGTFY